MRRGLVGAVLGPHHREDAQLDLVGLAAQALEDDGVFVGLQAVFGGELGHGLGGAEDGGFAGVRGRGGHGGPVSGFRPRLSVRPSSGNISGRPDRFPRQRRPRHERQPARTHEAHRARRRDGAPGPPPCRRPGSPGRGGRRRGGPRRRARPQLRPLGGRGQPRPRAGPGRGPARARPPARRHAGRQHASTSARWRPKAEGAAKAPPTSSTARAARAVWSSRRICPR